MSEMKTLSKEILDGYYQPRNVPGFISIQLGRDRKLVKLESRARIFGYSIIANGDEIKRYATPPDISGVDRAIIDAGGKIVSATLDTFEPPQLDMGILIHGALRNAVSNRGLKFYGGISATIQSNTDIISPVITYPKKEFSALALIARQRILEVERQQGDLPLSSSLSLDKAIKTNGLQAGIYLGICTVLAMLHTEDLTEIATRPAPSEN